MDNKNKYIYILTSIVLWAVTGFFCFSFYSYTSSRVAGNHHLIGASYMTMNNEFYKIMNEEISQRVEAEGDQIILRDPALSVERQIEQINEMLDMGIDVLVLTPVDWASLTDVLKRAKEMGVYIVVVDSNVKDSSLVDCTITSNNYAAGKFVADYFIGKHTKAKVVLMVQDSAKSGRDRTQGFVNAISEYKDIEIVDEIECEGQLEIAMPLMQDLLESGIEFDTVFCLNDLAAVGVVAALDEKGLLDQVEVYGVDASPDSKALIKEKMMVATAAQFPSQIGLNAADNIYKLLEGKTVAQNTYVPVELVTYDNVDSYGIERWQ
ncbi:MAG: sugar ABC transporter substrate-binding protein [Lachnospiraceae bacterium]|nr:sugar ABC transporter substrate-binding protein [Lachnospiraceae bacterium]